MRRRSMSAFMDGANKTVAIAAAIAVTVTMVGSAPASAAPDPTDVASDVSTPAAEEAASDAETDAASELAPESNPAPSAAPSAQPTAPPAAPSLPSSTSGAWVGKPSGPIPAQNLATAQVASAVLQKSPSPATPADSALIAKSQIAVSATKPQQVSSRALSTAGGLVTSKITAVPDADEVRAGITKAGTKIVISSDASKLPIADYQTLVASKPGLAKALFPVPMVGPGGTRSKSTIFRATFQAGEKIRIQGTVSPKALKKGATLIIEKAPVSPDGTLGRFIRTHTITPGKKDGKYAQDVVVRDGFEMIRHRLLLRKTTVAQPTINWAAVEARAEEILSEAEQQVLADIKAALLADIKAEIPAAEAALLQDLKVALAQEVKSFALAHISMVGTGVMTVNLTSLKGSRDITLNLANWPEDGCNPTTSDSCNTTSIPIPFDDEASKTATFIAPTEKNTIGFSADGKNGEKYTVNWSLDPNHTTTCAKIDPSPSALVKYGSTWDFQLKTNVQMEGYLSGNVADDAWSDQWSKKQNKGKTPLGCGFKATQSFGTWWTSLAGWEKILIEAATVVVVSLATFGVADLVGGAAAAGEAVVDTVGATEVALTATEASAEAIGEAFAELEAEAAAEAAASEAALAASDAAAEATAELFAQAEADAAAAAEAEAANAAWAAAVAEEAEAAAAYETYAAEFIGADATEVFEAADGELYATWAEVDAANAAVAAEAEAQTMAYVYLTGLGIGGVAALLGLGYGASKVFASNEVGTIVVN
ncbi:MAG: hypothetical protein GY871_00745 [Actinomycetales bacterium]|nr:hypothetical protein [Actinomycetales bacterium]MCP4892710.1 hypothetical protein [Actinomycetales bacterium]